jgi:hypothetical protein
MSPAGPRLCLKHPQGWFAAGAEMRLALTVLSDGAFKLYAYVCLHADRRTGQFSFLQADLARALHKSERSIATYLEELRRQQVCRVEPSPNQHQRGRIDVCDSFWPYHKLASSNDSPSQEPVELQGDSQRLADSQEGPYVDQVRRLFLKPACVRAAFAATDERLARDWRRRGISLEQVERAIQLGCARKLVAWANQRADSPDTRQHYAPITSLHYFSNVLEEVLTATVAPTYWRYVAGALTRFEDHWRAQAKFSEAAPAPEGETK